VNAKRLPAVASILAAAVLLLALAGCAPSSPHLPGSLSTSASHGAGVPTAHATTKPTAKPRPKLPAWNGDCTVLFTDAQSQAVTAHPTTLISASGFLYGYDEVTVLAGGHDCNYADADSDSENVALSVFPASLPGAASSAPHCTNANTGQVHFQDTCTAAVVSHGFWLNVDFTPGESLTYTQAFTAVDAITASFTTTTALYAPPVPSPTTAGTWTRSETCDTLAAHSGASAAIGYPAFPHTADPIYDGNGAAYTAAQSSVGALGCQWGSLAGLAPAGKLTGFTVFLVPGGGKVNPAAAVPVNSTAFTLPGATAAWYGEYNGNNVDFVYVAAGSNYFEFTPYGNQALSLAAIMPTLSKILSTMNAGG
jgi:hypothetical protein